MANFSTPKLTAEVNATLKAVVAELLKQGVPAKINDQLTGVSVVNENYPINMFDAEEDHLRFGPPNGKIRWHFRSLYLFTGTLSAKTFKNESKDLVTKLVRSVKERYEEILVADKRRAEKKEAQDEAAATQANLRASFPEFENKLNVNSSGITIKFDYLTVEKATKILQALKDAGITP